MSIYIYVHISIYQVSKIPTGFSTYVSGVSVIKRQPKSGQVVTAFVTFQKWRSNTWRIIPI